MVHFIKYSTSNIILHIEMSNNLCEKAKHTRERPTQGRGATFITTEMAVFTLETEDYSCETGYLFDDSRQIGKYVII